MIYAFDLGHQPHISVAEVLTLFAMNKWEYTVLKKSTNMLLLEAPDDADVRSLAKRFGGIVKTMRHVVTSEKINEQTLAEYLEANIPDGKIQFSLSGPHAKALALETKKFLKGHDRSVRYIQPKNTATIIHNNLVDRGTDLSIIENKLFVTIAVQDIEAFSERDYERPGVDAKSGMLPPKLARIMVNLTAQPFGAYILDPFCGSGTVLMEAAVLGYTNLIGSDLEEKAVEGTKKNLSWIKDRYGLEHLQYKVIQSPAEFLAAKLDSESIDAIVYEPYMGKPLHGNEKKETLEKQAKELRGLFIKSFQSFAKILKKNGTAVFIIPRFQSEGQWIEIHFLDELKKLGFELEPFREQSHLLYHRPGQHVGREIVRVRKTS